MAQLSREQIAEIIRQRESNPALMEVAQMLINGDAPAPKRGPVPVSRAAGRVYEDPQAVRDDELVKGRGYVAGIADMGGATSGIAKAAGVPQVSDWLEQAQQQAPGTSTVGSAVNPGSWAGPIWDAVKGVYDTVTAPAQPEQKIMSRDEFFQDRRKPRETLEEARSRAEREARDSSGVKSMIEQGMGKNARRAVSEAGDRAVEAWKQGQQGVAGEEAGIEKDYQSYIQGENQRLEAEHSKGFAERNPWFKAAIPFGSLAAGLLTRGASNKIAKTGEGLIAEVEAARKAGDIGNLSRAEKALAEWNATAGRNKLIAGAGAATIPTDVRGMADVVDKYGLPAEYYDASGELQRSEAQKRAEDHLQPANFFSDALPALASGAVGALTGSKMAKPLPSERASAIVNPATEAELTALARREALSASLSRDVQGARQAGAGLQSSGAQLQDGNSEALRRLSGLGAEVQANPVPALPASVSKTRTPRTPAAAKDGSVAQSAPAKKDDFWNQVEAAMSQGVHPADLNPADFKGLSHKAVKDRLERISNVLDRPNLPPQQAAKLLRALRDNDMIKLGMAAPVAAAGVSVDRGEGY